MNIVSKIFVSLPCFLGSYKVEGGFLNDEK